MDLIICVCHRNSFFSLKLKRTNILQTRRKGLVVYYIPILNYRKHDSNISEIRYIRAWEHPNKRQYY